MSVCVICGQSYTQQPHECQRRVGPLGEVLEPSAPESAKPGSVASPLPPDAGPPKISGGPALFRAPRTTPKKTVARAKKPAPAKRPAPKPPAKGKRK